MINSGGAKLTGSWRASRGLAIKSRNKERRLVNLQQLFIKRSWSNARIGLFCLPWGLQAVSVRTMGHKLAEVDAGVLWERSSVLFVPPSSIIMIASPGPSERGMVYSRRLSTALPVLFALHTYLSQPMKGCTVRDIKRPQPRA